MTAAGEAPHRADAATAQLGTVVAQDVMVPMRDGVRLAMDVYRPAMDGEPVPRPLPVILGRTSYNKRNEQMWVRPVAEFFVPRGYVVALQDLRGRHASEGFGDYFHTCNPKDGQDGYDTVEWIAAQRWCNGRVGTVGSSQGAIAQQTMALHKPPHLTAMWPDSGPTNIYDHEAREGGAMALHMFAALFMHAQDAQETRESAVAQRAIVDAMRRMREVIVTMPVKPGSTALVHVPGLEKTLFDYYYRGIYDEFWAQECCDQESHFHRHVDVPMTVTCGWWDPFAPGATRYFAAMKRQNDSPQRLVMGPWTHDGMRDGDSHAGNVDFGAASVWGSPVYNAARLRWFDRWLKEEDNGVDAEPEVLIFVMGGGPGRRNAAGRLNHGGEWRAECEWPLARMQATPYYLHADGSLSKEAPVAVSASRSYSFDPAHPVPTIAANVGSFFELVDVDPDIERFFGDYVPNLYRMRNIVGLGGAHQKEEPHMIGARFPYPALAAKGDVLVFQTAPLMEDVELTGPITAHLWISSSATDTDFTAKLLDVYPPSTDYPDGYHLNLVDSIIRTRYRLGCDREVPLEPDEVSEVTIRVAPTSNLFQRGHRLRIDVSSSNFPRFDVNPNTGEPVGRHTRTAIAHNTVHLDQSHPSHVVLPVIPRS